VVTPDHRKAKQDVEHGIDTISVTSSSPDTGLQEQQQDHTQQQSQASACHDDEQPDWELNHEKRKQHQKPLRHIKQQWQRRGYVDTSSSSSSATRSSTTEALPPTRLKVFLVAAAIGTTISACSLANVFASRYIPAYLVQMIVMLTPLVTAVANKLILRQPTPPMLWPTLAISLAGSGLVIAGQWMQAAARSNEGGGGAGAASANKFEAKYLLAGISMSLLSMLLQASFFLAVQVTRHIVTGAQVLWGQRNTSVFGMLILALTIEGTDWGWFFALDTLDWVVLLIAGIVVSVFADIGMQFVSRAVGAAAVSSVISLRLVASLIGSIVLLGDIPKHPALWVGFVLMVVAMSAYMVWQYRAPDGNSKEAQAAATAAAATATGAGESDGTGAGAIELGAGAGRCWESAAREASSKSRCEHQQHDQRAEWG
jgi:drug/metabolite transporter (DMT)-like permease